MLQFIWTLFSIQASDATRNAIDSVKSITQNLVTDITTTQGLDKLQNVLNQLIEWGVDMGMRILAAVAIFVIGRFIIRIINKLIKKILNARNVDPSVKSFLESLANALLLTLLAIAIISKLGIETTSFAALLASVGVAIGMALSGNLQNFAGGIIILLFRPYKVGDFIEAGGQEGTVTSIQIFHTIIRTYKGTNIYIPNGTMSSTTIKNYSKEPLRMVEWIISIEYGEDVARAEKAIENILKEDKRILATPEPYIALIKLAESSVDITVRIWTDGQNYASVLFDGNRRIYDEFNKQGISFPFPQLTIHQA